MPPAGEFTDNPTLQAGWLDQVRRSGILPCVEAKDYSVDPATSYLRTAPLVPAGSRVRTANAAGDPWAG
jgi:hypothetical protein